VSIPEDDWDGETEAVAPREVVGEFVGDAAGLRAVAAALDGSARPALVVGPGIDRDGAWHVTVTLAERTGATVWVSPLSSRCGFPEDHSAFAGFLTPDRRKLRDQLAGHDVIVVLGAPVFTYHVPSGGPFLPDGAALFQLVDDPAAAAYAPVGTAVLTSLGPGVAEIVKALVGPARPVATGRAPRPAPAASDPMTGPFVMHTIDAVRPPTSIVVEEAPSHRNALHDHLLIRRPGGFYAGASGGLGYALPAAVGVTLGSPGERVVCLLGDGSSLYSIQALWTAVQEAVPVSVVIFDNHGYAALKAFAQTMGVDRPPGVDLPGIDFLELAAGFGCAARRVERADELEAALRWSFASAGPSLVAVAVDDAVERLY
jgi:benzoylformate decarboxylase